MSAREFTGLISQKFFKSPPGPCPYIKGREEQKVFTLLGPAASAQDQNTALTQAGYRRSQNLVYRQSCIACQACLPVRVPVPKHAPSSSMRRVINANSDLTVTVQPPIADKTGFELFRRYQKIRHAESEMAGMNYADYKAMLSEGYHHIKTLLLHDQKKCLKGVLIFDELNDGASAVYSFFDPEETKRSLGSYLVLSLIEHLQNRKQNYLYLGYWIKNSQKMNYKTRFQPVEALGPNGWEPLEDYLKDEREKAA